MTRDESVAETLSGSEIHDRWETVYRTDANERVYEEMFDRLMPYLPPVGSHVLDAGCGVGAHTRRLARRGFRVTGIDFSEHVIPQAEENIRAAGLQDSVTVQRDDLTALSFDDDAFDGVMAWGVLMHVPAVDKALDEITRVCKPGGKLLISEVNLASPEALVTRELLRRLSSRPITARRTAAGIEHEEQTESGVYIWRHADIGWIEDELARRGWTNVRRVPGHFTELYQRAPARAANILHGLNRAWIRQRRLTWPGKGTMLVADRPG